jgi:DMSO/TMAO reductase YedYZ molybdopterin-dependent catalytic subunit
MMTRRCFLARLLGWCGCAWALIVPAVRAVMADDRRILPKGTRATTLYQENPAKLDIHNLEITPARLFGAMGQTLHTVDLATWRLNVAGEVDHPLALSYGELRALPSMERRVLLVCPDTFSFLAEWKGVSLRHLLEIARGRRGVTQVEIRSADDLIERVERFPIEDVVSEKVFLSYQVNGEPLPQAHGFPLRIVAEDGYGNHWVKYVVSVRALASKKS